MDIVYVLGTGSKWSNNEIRYSIRSVVKNLKGFDRIIICGADPRNLQNITHVATNDPYRNNADGNMIHKVLTAIKMIPDLSENFLYMNDDWYILKPINIEDIKPWYKYDLAERPDSEFPQRLWRKRLLRTKHVLLDHGHKALHFDGHMPLIMNKKLFPEVLQYDYQITPGYTIKSLYANTAGIQGVKLQGEKVTIYRHKRNFQQIEDHLGAANFLAFNDNGLNPVLKDYLEHIFPKPSKYEIMKPQTTKQKEIFGWLKSRSKSFDKGLALYIKYGVNRSLKVFLTKNKNTAIARKRLVQHLARLVNYPFPKIPALANAYAAKAPKAKTAKKEKPAITEIPAGKESDQPLTETKKHETSPRIKKHPTIDYDKLPKELQVLYDNNVEINRKMGALHAKMKVTRDDKERSQCLTEIHNLSEIKDANWKQIDDSLAPDAKKEPEKDPEPQPDEFSKGQQLQKKINAHRSYISRYKNSENSAIQEKVKQRIEDLKALGIDVKV